MASNKLLHLLVIGLVLFLANNNGVETASATRRRTTSTPSLEISVNNTHDATISHGEQQAHNAGRKRTLRRRIRSTTTTEKSSDIATITPSTLSVALGTRSTLTPSTKTITSDTAQSFVKVQKPDVAKTRIPTLAPALLSHGDARVHDTPMGFYDGPSEPEDAYYSYSERESFDSLVADEPSFSSSELYSLYPPHKRHSVKLEEQQTKDHKRETAQQQKHYQPNAQQGQHKPERCQKVYKPMPTHAHSGKKLMMTCYVCGNKDQPYVDGGYLEECNYSPTQRRNVYASPYGQQSPYIGTHYNNPIYKESGPYEGEATPQATSHSSSRGGSSNGKGDKCKVYYKGHMKCTSCDDGSGAYSDQCDYEANDPGKHHQSAYNYGTQNGKPYGKQPSSADGYGNSGSYGSGNQGSYGGPYGDEDSYGGGGGGGDDGYGSSGYPYTSGTSNTEDDYGNDDYYGPDYGKDSYDYDGNGDYGQPKSGSDSYNSHGGKGSDAGGKDTADNGKATTNNNCQIVYKDMTSYSPYVKKGSKPKMKCMVCEGKDGTTEECNYSGGGNSYPGASSDLAAIYASPIFDDFAGFLI